MRVLLKIGYRLFILLGLCILLLQPKGYKRREFEVAYATTDKNYSHIIRTRDSEGLDFPVFWDPNSFPIPVYYTGGIRHFTSDEYILEQAIDVWNNYFDREVFELINYRPMNGVSIGLATSILRESDKRSLLGICRYYHEDQVITRADITISILAKEDLVLFRTIVHELGHSLGFAHVNDNRCLMYPNISGFGVAETYISNSYISPMLIPEKARREFESYYSGQ